MGKGSKQRPTNLKFFYKNYDQINWYRVGTYQPQGNGKIPKIIPPLVSGLEKP